MVAPTQLDSQQRELLLASLLRAAASWASMAAESRGETAINFATRADEALDLWNLLRAAPTIVVSL